jgi:DNA-directed RNA polymerase specialized sigma24 family protein
VRKISNEEFLCAYNNEENKKIMNAACKKFRIFLDKETIESNKQLAMLLCLRTFDPNKSNFKTYLYNGIIQQFLSSTRKSCKHKSSVNITWDGHTTKDYKLKDGNDTSLIDLLDIIDTVKHGEILLDKYLYKENIIDLSKKYKVSVTTISKRIKRAKKELKEKILVYTELGQ